MNQPSFSGYSTLESLLEGYSKDPVISTRYLVSSSEDQDNVTKELLSRISSLSAIDENTRCRAERIIAEAVQNIHQHCCGESDIRLYASQDGTRFIGAFELNEEAQFGQEGFRRYRDLLEMASMKAHSPDYINELAGYLGSEDDELDLFYFGTIITMRTPGVKQIGIVDIAGKAYFFFEYSLGQ